MFQHPMISMRQCWKRTGNGITPIILLEYEGSYQALQPPQLVGSYSDWFAAGQAMARRFRPDGEWGQENGISGWGVTLFTGHQRTGRPGEHSADELITMPWQGWLMAFTASTRRSAWSPEDLRPATHTGMRHCAGTVRRSPTCSRMVGSTGSIFIPTTMRSGIQSRGEASSRCRHASIASSRR